MLKEGIGVNNQDINRRIKNFYDFAVSALKKIVVMIKIKNINKHKEEKI